MKAASLLTSQRCRSMTGHPQLPRSVLCLQRAVRKTHSRGDPRVRTWRSLQTWLPLLLRQLPREAPAVQLITHLQDDPRERTWRSRLTWLPLQRRWPPLEAPAVQPITRLRVVPRAHM